MQNNQKIRLLTVSDHPLVPSGVAIQSRYIIEGLLRTGNYTIRSLGGAIRHDNYQPIRVADYGEDWYIYNVDGYGDPNMIRDILDHEKPDAIWFMTDPRFYWWLFNMSDEIRDRGIPLLYYHVWDNYPVPQYNKPYYQACDYVGCISKLTHDILKQTGFADKSEYIPHAVDAKVFKPLTKEEILNHRETMFGKDYRDKFIVFYNSRNARRKMTSDVVATFKKFSDIVGEDKAFLFMQTDPHDQEGANLLVVAEMLGLKSSQIMFSKNRVPPEQMATFYNISDVTMNISNNEGWGLSSTESLYCGTPVISTRTGGLQDQNIDHETGEQYGVSVIPTSRSLQGSQQIPYIYDDRCSEKDLVDALLKMYNMSWQERKDLGLRAREYALKNFNLENMIGKWDSAIKKYVEQYKTQKSKTKIKFAKI